MVRPDEAPSGLGALGIEGSPGAYDRRTYLPRQGVRPRLICPVIRNITWELLSTTDTAALRSPASDTSLPEPEGQALEDEIMGLALR